MRRGKTATILSNNTKNIIPGLRPSQTNSPTTAVIPQNINQYRAQNMTKSPAAADTKECRSALKELPVRLH